MLIDPQLVDMEWHDYITRLIRYRLWRASDEQVDEVRALVMARLKRMARRQTNLAMKRGERSMKALLAQAVRWSVVDWLRYINAKKRQAVVPKRSSLAVEQIAAADPGIEAIIWPRRGVTVWSVRGILTRDVYGQEFEKVPHRALLRAVLWQKSYNEIQREFHITRNQLRGRVYRARRKMNALWRRAEALQEIRWDQERREARREVKVGGFGFRRRYERKKSW